MLAAIATLLLAVNTTPVPKVTGPIPVTADSYPFLAANKSTPAKIRYHHRACRFSASSRDSGSGAAAAAVSRCGARFLARETLSALEAHDERSKRSERGFVMHARHLPAVPAAASPPRRVGVRPSPHASSSFPGRSRVSMRASRRLPASECCRSARRAAARIRPISRGVWRPTAIRCRWPAFA